MVHELSAKENGLISKLKGPLTAVILVSSIAASSYLTLNNHISNKDAVVYSTDTDDDEAVDCSELPCTQACYCYWQGCSSGCGTNIKCLQKCEQWYNECFEDCQ